MQEATLSILLLWVFILVYVIAGALDFGSGFWAMVYSNQKNTNAGNIANKYLSPSWEVTNVFLVMFVVALVSFFPRATFTFGTVLLFPASVILILISLRTAFMVFGHYTSSFKRVLNWISGISGLLIPALLVVVLPVTHGGYIEERNGVLELPLVNVFSSFNVYAFITLAISTTLYLSALFLADYSSFAGDKSAVFVYRKQAIRLGPVVLNAGLLVFFTLRYEAEWLYLSMLNFWPWLVLSVLSFVLGYWSILKTNPNQGGKTHFALYATILQLLFAGYAYGSAHLPYLIYPATVEESFTNLSMYQTLIYSYLIGTLLLIPVLIYHWRLFVRDRGYVGQK